jgi:hypothetical protein
MTTKKIIKKVKTTPKNIKNLMEAGQKAIDEVQMRKHFEALIDEEIKNLERDRKITLIKNISFVVMYLIVVIGMTLIYYK